MDKKLRILVAVAAIVVIFVFGLFSKNDFARQGRIRVYSKGHIKVDANGNTKVMAVSRGKVYVFPVPAMPPSNHPKYPSLPYHACKRVDIHITPYGNDPTKQEGGETIFKGGCTAGREFRPGGKGTRQTTPSPETIEVHITMTQTPLNFAKNLCERLNPGSEQTKFLKLEFPAKLWIRYCYLDMRGKVKNGKRFWKTDCGDNKYTKEITQSFIVPVMVECAKN